MYLTVQLRLLYLRLKLVLEWGFLPHALRLINKYGGDEETRTPDPLLARQVLSQLSYTPILRRGRRDVRGGQKLNRPCRFIHTANFSHLTSQMVGLDGLEPSTSRLSGVRSNQLSYRPIII